jgi:methanogenic corrinoid protein MtbC1
MEKIGTLWKDDENGIWKEHVATDICIQAFNLIRTVLHVEPGYPQALGGAVQKDPYLLPSLIASCVLMAEGFHAINLGPNTPFESFQHAIDKHKPVLTWISISTCHNSSIIVEGVRELVKHVDTQNNRIVIGGNAHQCVKKAQVPEVYIGNTMAELSAFAKGCRMTLET